MQHGASAFHHAQHKEGEHEPEIEETDGRDDANSARETKSDVEGHFPKDNGELLMSEGERPKTEVRGSMGNAIKAEF